MAYDAGIRLIGLLIKHELNLLQSLIIVNYLAQTLTVECWISN